MTSRAVRPPLGVAAALRSSLGHPPPGAGAAARRPRSAASSPSLSSAAATTPAAAATTAPTTADGSSPPSPPTSPPRRHADTDHVVARRAWRAAVHRARVAYAAEAAAAAAAVAATRGNEAEVAAAAKRQRDKAKAYVFFVLFSFMTSGVCVRVMCVLFRREDGGFGRGAGGGGGGGGGCGWRPVAAGTPRGRCLPARCGRRGGAVAPAAPTVHACDLWLTPTPPLLQLCPPLSALFSLFVRRGCHDLLDCLPPPPLLPPPLSHSSRAVARSTAAAASRAAAAAAADERRRVRAATWEANAAAALGRQMGLVNALTDASGGWISRERLGDAVERLVDETYVEMDEQVLDPPVSLIPAGF